MLQYSRKSNCGLDPDRMMSDVRRGKFDAVLVGASDRLARSVNHFLNVPDELNPLGVEFIRFRENVDPTVPKGVGLVTTQPVRLTARFRLARCFAVSP